MLDLVLFYVLCLIMGCLSIFGQKSSLMLTSAEDQLASLLYNRGLEITFLLFSLEFLKGIGMALLIQYHVYNLSNSLYLLGTVFFILGYQLQTQKKNLFNGFTFLLGTLFILYPVGFKLIIAFLLSFFLLSRNFKKSRLLALVATPVSLIMTFAPLPLIIINFMAMSIIFYPDRRALQPLFLQKLQFLQSPFTPQQNKI